MVASTSLQPTATLKSALESTEWREVAIAAGETAYNLPLPRLASFVEWSVGSCWQLEAYSRQARLQLEARSRSSDSTHVTFMLPDDAPGGQVMMYALASDDKAEKRE